MWLPARIAGVAAAMLPKRWWPALDPYIPVTTSAPLSAILTFMIAAAIGIPGFLDHTSEQVSFINQSILDAAASQASRPESQDASEADWGKAIRGGVTGLSIFTFILLTPAGWMSTYLGISSVWRGMGAAVDDPFGDPILTGIDTVLFRGARLTRERAARNRRESLEGPEVPDHVARGSELGIAGAVLVIVASRPKPGWDKGTVVDTGDAWYRVGTIEERTIGGRLRTLYPLTEHTDLEVFRRAVRYEIKGPAPS